MTSPTPKPHRMAAPGHQLLCVPTQGSPRRCLTHLQAPSMGLQDAEHTQMCMCTFPLLPRRPWAS